MTNELFGDDLLKAVKDMTDTNRITSKINRDNHVTTSSKKSWIGQTDFEMSF